MRSDVDTLARTLWGEARGEGLHGMEAVACVIANRVRLDLGGDDKPDWWGEGWTGVCQKPWQFSCWNANDPNRVKLMAVGISDTQFAQALVLAEMAVTDNLCDMTGGATHYYDTRMPEAPKWAVGRTPTYRYKHHVFFNLHPKGV